MAHAFETPVKYIVSKGRPSGWDMFSRVLFILSGTGPQIGYYLI